MAKIDLDAIKPNNSSHGESERKEKSPIVQKGDVVSTKPSGVKKFFGSFLESDAEDIKDYVLMDWLIPTVKDGFMNLMNLLVYGSTGNYSSSRDRGHHDYTSHYGGRDYGRSKSKNDRDRRRREDPRDDDYEVDYQDIVLRHREVAEDVIDDLHRTIRDNGYATIADLFSLVGVSSQYTDNNWGWYRVSDIGLKRVNGGWLIDVAKARAIDD